MKKTKFTEQQIVFALKQAESGTRVDEIWRKMGVLEATYCNWKKQYAGLGITNFASCVIRRNRMQGWSKLLPTWALINRRPRMP